MSLITQMLNDLDKRKASAEEELPMFGDVRPLARSRSPLYSAALLLLLVIVAAGIGAWAWSRYRNLGEKAPVKQMIAAKPLPKETPLTIQANPASTETPAPALSAPQSSRATVAAKGVETKQVGIALRMDSTIKNPAKGDTQGKPMPKPSPDQVASFKIINPQQQSDNFYRQAVALVQKSQTTKAQEALRLAIRSNPANHDARQLLAGLLSDTGRHTEAAALLRDGLKYDIGGISLALAKVQLASGSTEEALSTLENGLSAAEVDAEYHAFLAALLQKQGRHDEATQHYIMALKSDPAMPHWLIGVGISLMARNKMKDAEEAFQRAIDTGELSPEVAQYANQQLKLILQQR